MAPFAAGCVLGGCGLFLDDLSTEPPLADDAGAADAVAADVAVDARARDVETPDDVVAPPVIEDLDGSAPDGDASRVLDCDATVLCDGFEGRKTLPEAPVGEWRDNQLVYGTVSIVDGNAAGGQSYVDFVSPANTTQTSRILLLGDNELGIANNVSPTVVADFDMHVYGYASLGPGERRNFIGVYLYSDNSNGNQEYAGLSISATKGLHAEMRKYASASSTSRDGDDDPYDSFPLTTLTGRWHHVRMEMRFARDTSGGMKVSVDGAEVASIANIVSRTNQSTAPMFVFWIGNNAGAGTPAFNVRYDNVEVRTK